MKIILFLILYIPIQEFLLKWLPIDERQLFVLRQLPEALILMLALKIIYGGLRRGRLVHSGTRIELLVLIFIGFFFLTLAVNHKSNIYVNVSELVVLLRYFLLFFCIIALNPTRADARRIIALVSLAFSVQGAIGIVQLLGGDGVREFFAAREYTNIASGVAREFTGDDEGARNSIFGTVGDFTNFAYLMAIGVFIALAKAATSRVGYLPAILGLAAIYFSTSRTIFVFTVLMALAFMYFNSRDVLIRFAFVIVGAFIGVLAIFLYDYAQTIDYSYSTVWALFRAETISTLLNQRLGVLIYFLPELIQSGDFIVGLSPDRFYIKEVAFSQYFGMPYMLLAVLEYVFEDVYFVALLAYYGLGGFLCWVMIWLIVYKKAKLSIVSNDLLIRETGLIVMLLVIASVFYNFANQAYEARVFSFYLWLFSGLLLSLLKRHRWA